MSTGNRGFGTSVSVAGTTGPVGAEVGSGMVESVTVEVSWVED
jgi:hypothetical protein